MFDFSSEDSRESHDESDPGQVRQFPLDAERRDGNEGGSLFNMRNVAETNW